MEYRVYVFNNDKMQDVTFNLAALQRLLASYDCSLKGFSLQEFENDEFKHIIEKGDNLILFFKNKEIDNVICDNLRFLGNQKFIIDDQIVVFTKGEQRIIFVPYDVEWQVILSNVNLNPLRPNKQCQLKLFGLQKPQIVEIMEKLKDQIQDLSYYVLNRGLLSDVYIAYTGSDDLIDDGQVKIATALQEYIYSENSLELARSIRQLANLKGLKLAICEGITGGSLLKEVCNNICIKQLLSKGKVEYLNGEVTPDDVYKQTLDLLEGEEDNVFAINVQGYFVDGGITCVYAMGNRQSIDVYKNSFKVKKELAVQYALDAIMFNIVKKLRQNNLAF